ncbi:hypothetical protein TrST_g3712 [Triparma strigata]|uniref:Uncharacterized protein n=1 Tax=Triparma strigata TaxID=1606541 RepID=A0A9W7DY49_9STRA|nr:hypothetical protein TrST_g3712 [Triparma strigata]
MPINEMLRENMEREQGLQMQIVTANEASQISTLSGSFDEENPTGQNGSESEPSAPPMPTESRFGRIFTTNLLPDSFTIPIPIFYTVEPLPEWGVRAFKFAVVTTGGILGFHRLIRKLGYEHDPIYDIEHLMLYDLHAIALDAFTFFAVGRGWKNKGCDTLGYLIPLALSAWFFSAMTEWSVFRYNVSMYQIMCVWPTELYFFAGAAALGLLVNVIAHVVKAIKEGVFIGRALEIVLTFAVFCAPVGSSPFFHFHHWFFAWFVGLHANFDTWWSRASQGLLWGVYINGIAGYGRDSLLGCLSAYYNSLQGQCGHLEQEGSEFCINPDELPVGQNISIGFDHGMNTTGTDVDGHPFLGFGELVAADWETCTPGSH